MREIKFRAWLQYSNQMINNAFMMRNDGVADFGSGGYGVLMQYTGLKDSKGKEIYEGDIVNFVTYEEEKLEVYWYNETCGWQMKRIVGSGTMFIPNYTDYLEVIGNIYENPELLEV